MDLDWHPMHGGGSIMLLQLGSDALARVDQMLDGRWASTVRYHLRDYRRRLRAVHATRAAAMKHAERWTRANLDRIRSELPTTQPAFGCRRAVWPASNPAPRG